MSEGAGGDSPVVDDDEVIEPLRTDVNDPQMAADIRTLMAKLMGPVYPSDAKAEGAWRRV